MAKECDKPKRIRPVPSNKVAVNAAEVELETLRQLPSYECAHVVSNSNDAVAPVCPGEVGDRKDAPPKLKISPLTFVDVIVSDIKLRALVDSGSMVPLIKAGLFAETTPIGRIQIKGITGPPHEVPLMTFDVKLARSPSSGFVLLEQTLPVVFAVNDSENMMYDVVLPPDVVKELQDIEHCEIIDGESVDKYLSDEMSDGFIDSDDFVSLPTVASSAETFATEQRADKTLSDAFRWATAGKMGYSVENGLLYHTTQIANQAVTRLVVPVGRRPRILEIAHDSIFSGHLAAIKTRQRIAVLSLVNHSCRCRSLL